MWRIKTDDGHLISETECLWPELPAGTRIAHLIYRDRRGRDVDFHGFELYGFQRYALAVPGAVVAHAGTQLIGIAGDQVTVADINEVTGEAKKSTFPLSELTYTRNLLRLGVTNESVGA